MFGKSVKTIIITSNLFFILINTIFVGFALFLANRISAEIAKQSPLDTLISEVDKADENTYQNIPVKKYIGCNGYIEILDERLNLIYSGKPDKTCQYTPELMHFISDLDKNTSYHIRRQNRPDNKMIYMISEYSYEDGQNKEYEYCSDAPSGITILNSEYRLVYSTMNNHDVKSLTRNDVDMLTDNNDSTFFVKHTFFNNKKEKRYMIAHLDSHNNPFLTFSFVLVSLSSIFSIISILFTNMFFSNIITKKVKKSIMAINQALKDIAEYKTIDKNELLKLKDFIIVAHSLEKTCLKVQEQKLNFERSIKEKTDLVSEYAHDIKNSFMSLSICMNKLKNTSSHEEIKEYISTLSVIAGEAEELFHHLTEYNLISNPCFQLDIKKADLSIIFRHFVAAAYKEFKCIGCLLKIEINVSEVTGYYDCHQLLRVFNNIKYNFIKYCDKSNVVNFSLKASGNIAHIELGNNGTPIDSSIRDTLFQPGITGTNSSNKKSSGLGLAFASKIISMHSGKIELLDDKDNIHNIFHIELPLTDFKRAEK